MADETSKTQATEGDGLTRRRALGYGGAVAAGVAVSQVAAGGAAAAAATSEVMRSITLAQANRIVAAGVRYASRTAGIPPMFVLVVDACGDEKASRRMDGNGPASVVLVPVKAHTSRSFRASTADLAGRTTDPARIASFTAAGFSLLGGGRPIFDGDILIGAIGVGGGTPEQDDEVAAAALRAL